MEDLTPAKKAALIQKLRTDPVFHMEKIQGVLTTEEYQKKIMRTVALYPRTVVSSCHDMGKTWTAAHIVLWFLSTFPRSKVITTAPTFNQVKMLLWSEIRAGYAGSKMPLGGDMMVTQWKIDEDWFAIGYTSKSEGGLSTDGQGSASSFQGFHAEYILVIFDEATGISPGIWIQAEGLLTSGFVRFLGIGNPTTRACEFYKCFNDPSYKKIHLSCFDSPNFISTGIKNKQDLRKEMQRIKELPPQEQTDLLHSYPVVNQYLLTVQWVMALCLKYGLEHPIVVSKCFGEFPETDESTLISLGTIEKACYREWTPDTAPKHDAQRLAIGVDVARFGSDKTVITCIRGLKQIDRKVLIHRDTMQVAGEVIQTLKKHLRPGDSSCIVVDSTGIGSGVLDALKQTRSERYSGFPDRTEIRELHFGWSAGTLEKNPTKAKELDTKYVNMKAYIYCLLAEDLESKLCLTQDTDVYAEELPTIQYQFDSKGRWVIESKDDYRKRTGRSSPDDSDSLAMANFGRYDYGWNDFFSQSESTLSVKKSTISNVQRSGKLW